MTSVPLLDPLLPFKFPLSGNQMVHLRRASLPVACYFFGFFFLHNFLSISLCSAHNTNPPKPPISSLFDGNKYPPIPSIQKHHRPIPLLSQTCLPKFHFLLCSSICLEEEGQQQSNCETERNEKGAPMDGSIVMCSTDKNSNNPNPQQQPQPDGNRGVSYQNVVVMRHGDRMDNFDPLWAKTAQRPWDPPLVDAGLVRAFSAGRKFRTDLGFPIHRVFVSPFIRCVQTASEVVSALCAVNGGEDVTSSASGIDIDPSKLKVSIEYGLCEMMNGEAIRFDVAPKDGNFAFNKSELEALLPAGTVDHTAKPVYEELPEWEESATGSRTRYEQIFKALADMYPSENLLLVTHGEGVGVSVSAFLKDVTVYDVDYCGYSLLRRPIFQKEQSFSAGNFEQLTLPGQTGIGFCSTDSLVNGAVGDVA